MLCPVIFRVPAHLFLRSFKNFNSSESAINMTEVAVEVTSTPVVAKTKTPKKKAAAAVGKKAKVAPTHPPTAQMVNAAIKTLKERGGSSLPAIKKYISTTYKVDVAKLAPFIKKYLVSAVANKKLIQTKGKGASGSFKLAVSEKANVAKKPKVVKKIAPKKAAAPKVKKVVAPKAKKSAAPKKPKTPKKAAASKKIATPKKKVLAKPKVTKKAAAKK